MCGICGIVDWQRSDRRDQVTSMCEVMEHRGPDYRGVIQLRGCCLGHQRLSILDLSESGNQPMANEDGTVWVVFNGEAYGFEELVTELRGAGHRFRSRSDTEVILHGYEQWGMAGLCRRLRGMFAIALWDQSVERLFLARDRFGEKPLYYVEEAGEVRFASTARALYQGCGPRPELSPPSLVQYLHYGFCLPQAPILAGLKAVLPATFITFSRESGPVTHQYWEPSFVRRKALEPSQWVDQVEERLEASVRRQLVADVPVGCLLSGGVDSSLVAYYAVKAKPDLQVFTVRMPGSDLDETEKATSVAREIGAQHHVIDAEPVAMAQFSRFQSMFSEPLGDASAIAAWMVAGYARRHVKVILTGDGGDELFAGYKSVQLQTRMEPYRRWMANRAGRSLVRLANVVAGPLQGLPLIRRALTFGRLISTPLQAAHTGSHHIPLELESLLWGPRLKAAVTTREHLSLLERLWIGTDATLPLDQLQHFDLKFGLVGDYLPKVDSASMTVSLEARTPFLDHDLAELAFSIPPTIRIRGGVGKWVLKSLVNRRLPVSADQVIRVKQGFVVPIDRWLDGEWRELVEGVRTSPLISEGYLSAIGVGRVLAGARSDPERFSRLRYSLVALDIWYRSFSIQNRLLGVS